MKTFKDCDGYKLPYHCSLTNDDLNNRKNYIFEIHVPENQLGLDLAEQFKYACYDMPKDTNWFHQGGCLPFRQKSNWHMFEFWTDRQDLILEAVMAVVEELGLELQFERVTSDFYEYK